MKKWMISFCLILSGLTFLNAQEGLKGGGYIGLPSGNATDYFGLNYGASFYYHYPVFENLHLGAMAGLDHFAGKEIAGKNMRYKGLTFLPIGVSGQFNLSSRFFVTGDIGYAISLSKDYEGSFFFQPRGGWQDEYFQVFFFVKNITSELKTATDFKEFNSITSYGVGVSYKF